MYLFYLTLNSKNKNTFDILSNPDIRETLPTVSNWPTFPQLYIEGELIGGSDIMMDMYQNGELKKLIDDVEI